jgi:hypothetical protein
MAVNDLEELYKYASADDSIAVGVGFELPIMGVKTSEYAKPNISPGYNAPNGAILIFDDGSMWHHITPFGPLDWELSAIGDEDDRMISIEIIGTDDGFQIIEACLMVDHEKRFIIDDDQ